jgi:hypothetical protein
MEKVIHQYIKGEVKGAEQNVGVLVGCIDGYGIVGIGWSKVAHSRGDKFNRERGLEIAKGRMMTEVTVPYSLKDDTLKFMRRCKRYFKDMNSFVPVHTIYPTNKAIMVLNYELNKAEIS